MKFGRYLKDHQINEWKRAYINYRHLKKLIRRAEECQERDGDVEEGNEPRRRRESSADDEDGTPEDDSLDAPAKEGPSVGVPSHPDIESGLPIPSADTKTSPLSFFASPDDNKSEQPKPHKFGSPTLSDIERQHGIGPGGAERQATDESGFARLGGRSRYGTIGERPDSDNGGVNSDASYPHSRMPLRRESSGASSGRALATTEPDRPAKGQTQGPRGNFFRQITDMKYRAASTKSSQWRYPKGLPLPELLPLLKDEERRFFTVLDRELDKIEDFYDEREREAVTRFEILSKQLEQLAEHRKEYKAFQETEVAGSKFLRPLVKHTVPSTIARRIPRLSGDLSRTEDMIINAGPRASNGKNSGDWSKPQDDNGDASAAWTSARVSENSQTEAVRRSAILHGRPEAYKAARSKLKLAVFEFYRYLGLLRSYKLLNRTGFSKILKKYEKQTKIPCSVPYLQKIGSKHISTSTRLEELANQVEDLFAKFFEHGSRKRALERLRVLGSKKTHHFSAFRSGLMLGLAVPALVDGVVKSFKPSTREEIPDWPALMQLYAAEFLPVFFACLFSLNILAWRRARINYVLIFEFDLRTMLDFRQFIEIPAFLTMLLCYCFWLSFSNFWPDHIAATTWPLVWLIVTVVVMLNPFPIMFPHARWWLARSLARVITGGLFRVEFRDFFLGDQLVSLYYPMYNIGLLICSYSHNWDHVLPACSTNATWASAVLAALPSMWRLGQSIRRWVDSDGLSIHLINAGKYSASVLYYIFYFNWRINGSQHDWRFVLWIIFGVINSSYSLTWDLLMDWSLLKRNSRHWLLRPELGYRHYVPFYYFAMVADALLRFTWPFYFATQPSVTLQGWIVAMLEALRRFQWNFIRVESEHIGNADAFRVTRDTPLPYTLESGTHHEQEPDEDEEETKPKFFAFLHQAGTDIRNPFVKLSDLVGQFSTRADRQTGERTDGPDGAEQFGGEPDDGSPSLPPPTTSPRRIRPTSRSPRTATRQSPRVFKKSRGAGPESSTGDENAEDEEDSDELPDDGHQLPGPALPLER